MRKPGFILSGYRKRNRAQLSRRHSENRSDHPFKNRRYRRIKIRLNELNLHLQKTGNDSYLYLQFIVGNLYSSLFQELSRDGISAKLIFEDPVEEYRKLLNCNTIQKAIAVLSDNLMWHVSAKI